MAAGSLKARSVAGSARHRMGFRCIAALIAVLACHALVQGISFVCGLCRAGRQHVPPLRDSATSSVMAPEASSTDSELERLRSQLEAASEADRAVADKAYKEWSQQFPMIAKRRTFYCGTGPNGEDMIVKCGRVHVTNRFLLVAQSFGISAQRAFDILRKDLWVLNEFDEIIPEKVAALRSVAESDEEIFDLLSISPKLLGMTTVKEMKARGIADMRVRAVGDQFYDALISPIRFWFAFLRTVSANNIENAADDEDTGCSPEEIEEMRKKESFWSGVRTSIFFGGLISLCVGVTYLDYAYGGPVHGKGLCPASPIPTFNIPDAEGNTRLPCNCAPIYKWYIEPLLDKKKMVNDEGRPLFQPAVESKNCGKELGGQKRECNPLTVGGCVWTAEDLEKDPSVWDNRSGKTYWEVQAEMKGAR